MGTMISVSDLSEALAWLRCNVGEQIAGDAIDEKPYALMGHGWYVFMSSKVCRQQRTVTPINVVRIDNKEKSMEFALIFDKGI